MTDSQILLPIATGARSRAVIGELLRPRRALAVGGLIVVIASISVGLLTQPLLGHIVDLVLERRPASSVLTPVLLIAATAVVAGLLTALGVSLMARLGEGMLAELRERFVERALHLPLEEVELAGSGDLTSRVTNDVTIIGEAVRQALPEFTRSLLAIALTLVGLAVIDWRFMLAALVAVPVQAGTLRWYLRAAGPVYAEQRTASGAQQQQLLETIGGAATVRAFRLGDRQIERLAGRSRRTVDLTLTGIGLQTRFFSRLNLAEYMGLSAVLVAGYALVRGDAVTVGAATAAALYFTNLFTPINTALALLDEAQSAAASLARLVGVADLAPTPDSGPARADSGRAASVQVTGVQHAYLPGHDVLRDVDLEIPAGRRVALVGASGAGKTTLAKLIAGIHRPDRGTVHLGGVSLAELGPRAVRETVALVTQEVHVFAGPLIQDLRLARAEATVDEVRTALALVEALDWVEALPDGLETVVGDGGHRLTVAQAQQLALARLVLADRPIAILDEATAEAGSAGARLLERAAANALTGRTALVVAHRLTQAASADQVVVMEAGRVVEAGTHAELVAAGQRYAVLWRAWSDDHEAAPTPNLDLGGVEGTHPHS
jgi:ATP-binding cassette subfamily C protein